MFLVFFQYPSISSNCNLTHCTFWEACLHTPRIGHHTANPRSNEHGQDKLIYVLIDSSTKRGHNLVQQAQNERTKVLSLGASHDHHTIEGGILSKIFLKTRRAEPTKPHWGYMSITALQTNKFGARQQLASTYSQAWHLSNTRFGCRANVPNL